MIVLDASALIAFREPADAHHGDAVERIAAAGAGGLAMSPITHAEVLAGPARAGTLPRARSTIAALGVTEVAFSDDAAVRLAELRAQTSLRLPDCCVVLAAQQVGGSIMSFDDRLTRAAGGLGVALV